MVRGVFVLALAAITFSLTKSASVDPKQKDSLSKMMDSNEDMADSAVTLMKAMAECNETYTIDETYTQALNESGSFPDETQRTPKCYIRCVMETVGIATEDGVYDPSRTSMFIDAISMSRPGKTNTKDIAEKCSDRKETCKCDRAYQYIKCIIETNIKNNTK